MLMLCRVDVFSAIRIYGKKKKIQPLCISLLKFVSINLINKTKVKVNGIYTLNKGELEFIIPPTCWLHIFSLEIIYVFRKRERSSSRGCIHCPVSFTFYCTFWII